MCGYVRVYMCVYIYMSVRAHHPRTNQNSMFTGIYKEKNKFSSNYLLHVLLSRTQEQNIYIYTYIYLFIDRSTYLSIYLKIDKFNIYIYIHMYVHPPESTKTAFSLVFAKKKVFFQLSTPLRLSQQESLYYTWERCFCNDQANFSNPNRHPQRVHRGNRRRQTGTSSCCPKCHV